jgi:hypothetical protein
MEGVDKITYCYLRGNTIWCPCLVKENASRFPLTAKAAKFVLATPASEAICERLFKRAEQPIGWHGFVVRRSRYL